MPARPFADQYELIERAIESARTSSSLASPGQRHAQSSGMRLAQQLQASGYQQIQAVYGGHRPDTTVPQHYADAGQHRQTALNHGTPAFGQSRAVSLTRQQLGERGGLYGGAQDLRLWSSHGSEHYGADTSTAHHADSLDHQTQPSPPPRRLSDQQGPGQNDFQTGDHFGVPAGKALTDMYARLRGPGQRSVDHLRSSAMSPPSPHSTGSPGSRSNSTESGTRSGSSSGLTSGSSSFSRHDSQSTSGMPSPRLKEWPDKHGGNTYDPVHMPSSAPPGQMNWPGTIGRQAFADTPVERRHRTSDPVPPASIFTALQQSQQRDQDLELVRHSSADSGGSAGGRLSSRGSFTRSSADDAWLGTGANAISETDTRLQSKAVSDVWSR